MKSSELQPGTRLRHNDGEVVVLGERKKPGDSEFNLPGWWLHGSLGGLADIVIDDPQSDWTVLSGAVAVTQKGKTQ